jgi:hypothetical protein
MDPSRFDDIARSFSLSRRGAVRALIGAAASGAALLISGGAAGAKPGPFHRVRKPCDHGQLCGELTACEAGICRPKACLIDGAVYQPGDTNPANRCQFCDPDRNHERWVSAADGGSCPPPNAGDPCASLLVGMCQAGVCVSVVSPDNTPCGESDDPCRALVCQSGVCQSAPANDGVDCDNGENGVCVNRFGTCQTGTCVGNQEPDGTSCGFNNICCNGNCVTAQQCGDPDPGGGCQGDECNGICEIDGVTYEFGDHNPANNCQVCTESSERPTTFWQAAFDENIACGEAPVLRACCAGVCCPAGECCGFGPDFTQQCMADCPPP